MIYIHGHGEIICSAGFCQEEAGTVDQEFFLGERTLYSGDCAGIFLPDLFQYLTDAGFTLDDYRFRINVVFGTLLQSKIVFPHSRPGLGGHLALLRRVGYAVT